MRPAARTSWSAPTSSSRNGSRRVRTPPPASSGTGPAAPAGADPIPVSPIPAVNVASVPQRSPLRYPGGKTWLIPHIRHWLKGIEPRPKLLVEPFAGGGIVSLTAVMERLVDECWMIELDRDVAAFWRAALRHGPELCERVRGFEPTRKEVEALSPISDERPGTRLPNAGMNPKRRHSGPRRCSSESWRERKGGSFPLDAHPRLTDISNNAPHPRRSICSRNLPTCMAMAVSCSTRRIRRREAGRQTALRA